MTPKFQDSTARQIDQQPNELPSAFPSNIFLETTTRCNLNCQMCVRQTADHHIEQGDLSREIFDAIEPACASLDSLILSGIGEPLMHPELVDFVSRARGWMPDKGRIGFQSNALLLTGTQIDALMKAGLDSICISLDATSSELLKKIRIGADLDQIQDSFGIIHQSKKRCTRDRFRTGLEFVMMRDNLDQLPDVIQWAAMQPIDYVIVTHTLAYHESMTEQSLYGVNTDESWYFFNTWRCRATQQGIDLADYFRVRWKYKHTAEDQEIISFVEKMIDTAYEQGVPFHLRQLLAESSNTDEIIEAAFGQSQQIADANDLQLKLPAIRPRMQRRCDFIESDSTFISWDGKVHPCYFLWHSYVCYQHEHRKNVRARSFGSLQNDSLQGIWNSDAYRKFRSEVLQYDFPYCSNCNVGPCDLIYSEDFEQDCHTIGVPCGDCPWCMGVLQCLR